MNWGKGIVIGMVIFMSFIIFLVVNLMMQRVDLESEDYYKREINYEQEIAAVKNSEALPEKIKLLQQEEFVVVQVPEKGKLSSIEVRFLRPDDQKLDKIFKVEGTKSYLIPKEELSKGKYNIEISFLSDSKVCLQKEDIYI
jgi:nitrogen fixation protein FixH